jgi:putative CocE/NonD family hydrolase
MTLISQWLGRIAKLPPAETDNVVVERDLRVPMPDDVSLLADRYSPRNSEKAPLMLVRCPYGRSGFFGLLMGRLYAERGFQVVIQSVRGTFGSGGTLDPFGTEREDGLATVAWLKQQPWYPGSFVMNGASYLGFVQWAIGSDADPDLRALAIQVSTAEFRSQTYAGEAFSLDATLSWTHLIANQEKTNLFKQLLFPSSRVLDPLFAHLPLRDLDKLADGHHSPFFQEWLEHSAPGDEYWQRRDFRDCVKDITAPVNLIGGWYDIFLPWMLRDYHSLRDAGKRPYLTIGPWAHATPELLFFSTRESIPWLKACLHGEQDGLREAPIRLFVTGVNEWRDYADWPPPGMVRQPFYLHPDGALFSDLPSDSEPDHYRYDPANPTPSVAGPLLTGKALPTDNRKLEARSDVLIYSSIPLEQDLEAIGPVQAHLYIKSSLEHTDFFVRLCDVDQQGKSINVCDGLLRLVPGRPSPDPDGIRHIGIALWPTAHRFRAGHRVRVQVSSGAHPRFARNTGSGEPLATATKLLIAEQAIYHDPDHPSSIVLSVDISS